MRRYYASIKAWGLRLLLATTLLTPWVTQPTEQAMAATYGDIVISEIMYDSASAAPEADEWVELYNPGTTSVNVNGWILTDDDTYPSLSGEGQCVLPNVSIPSLGFVVIAEQSVPDISGESVCASVTGTFDLDNAGDNLALYNASGEIIFGSHVQNYADLAPDNLGYSIGLKDPMAGWSNATGDWTTETTAGSGVYAFHTAGVRNDGWNNVITTNHTITANGTVDTVSEWKTAGEQLGNVDGITYYLTWDAGYLYIGMVGGNATTDKYNVLIDVDPVDTGAANSGTMTNYCGGTFGANGKPDYAIQLDGTNVYRSKATTDGSGWEAWSTIDAGGNTNNNASGNAEFFIQKSNIGLTSTSPIGLYLYACNSSSQMWSAWPPENPGYSATPIELTTRTYLDFTPVDRSPRNEAAHLGYYTLTIGTTGLPAAFVFFNDDAGSGDGYNGFARLGVTANSVSCQVTVKIFGNRQATRLDGGVRRQYEINPSGCSGLTATVALKYEDNSLYGAPSEIKGLTESSLKLYRWTGTSWSLIASTQQGDPTRRVLSNATQTSFSPWTIASSSQAPTALTLTSISAQSEAGFPWAALAGAVTLLGGAALWAARRRARRLSR